MNSSTRFERSYFKPLQPTLERWSKSLAKKAAQEKKKKAKWRSLTAVFMFRNVKTVNAKLVVVWSTALKCGVNEITIWQPRPQVQSARLPTENSLLRRYSAAAALSAFKKFFRIDVWRAELHLNAEFLSALQ